MSQPTRTNAFVVPWRDRGLDPLRPANLKFVLAYLKSLDLGPVIVASDGREQSAKFCRHLAYNDGGRKAFDAGAETICFYESDMIVPREQLADGIAQAAAAPGLVVPFTQYRYLTPEDSARVRAGESDPHRCIPEYTMDNGRSIGAVNILSRASIEAVGQWDTAPDGNGYDDNMMHRAFEVCCGPTRYSEGPGIHLFHQPAWYGLKRAEVSDADREATARNKARYQRYLAATTPEQIRSLTGGE